MSRQHSCSYRWTLIQWFNLRSSTNIVTSISICTKCTLNTMFTTRFSGNITPSVICISKFSIIYMINFSVNFIKEIQLLAPWPIIAKINPLGRIYTTERRTLINSVRTSKSVLPTFTAMITIPKNTNTIKYH